MQSNVVTKEDVLAFIERAHVLATKEREPGDPPHVEHTRHPFQHFDFWCMLLSVSCTLAQTTSMIETYMLEPLCFGAIFFGIWGIIFNLTRDRQHVTIVKRVCRHANGPAHAVKNFWAQAQQRAGVTPLFGNADSNAS